jgi:hypothetical protein
MKKPERTSQLIKRLGLQQTTELTSAPTYFNDIHRQQPISISGSPKVTEV